MSPEEAEAKVLQLANENGKFAIELGYGFKTQDETDAFCRCLDNDLFRLFDITLGLAVAPGRVMILYRLTDAGWARRKELKGYANDP